MLLSLTKLWRWERTQASVTMEALAGSRSVGIPTLRASLPSIAIELRRARRYERPLAGLVLQPEGLQALLRSEEPSNGRSSLYLPLPIYSAHLVFFLLGSLLRDTTRETDIVSYAAEHHLYVAFLPETGESGARRAGQRLSRAFYERTSVWLRTGVAEYPRDGFTIEDLFDRAKTDSHAEPLPSYLSPALKEVSNA